MNKRHSKPKFVPPISTAASFLKSISTSPEPISISVKRPSVMKEFVPEFPRDLGLKVRTGEKCFSPKFLNSTRDISHLKDNLKSSLADKKNKQGSYFPILPTGVEHLKLLVCADECHSRSSSRTGHLCHKEKCLEEFLDRSSDQVDVKKCKSEELICFAFPAGSTTGKQDVFNLKEWFSHMKAKHLKDINEDLGFEEFTKKVDEFEVIIKNAIKEIIRQTSIQSQERGELLNELTYFLGLYYKYRNSHTIKKLKSQVSDLENALKDLQIEKDRFSKETSQSIKQLSNELEVKKSNLILREVEVDRLNDQIKKLKCEKVYRIKKELETYNQMLRTFKENKDLKEEASLRHDELKNRRKYQEATECVNQIVLAKMKLVEKSNENIKNQVDVDEDFNFKDAEMQVNIPKELIDRHVQATVGLVNTETETDELVDFVNIEDSENSTDGKRQSVRAYTPSQVDGLAGRKKMIFKYRLRMDKAVQTDGKLFLIESVKKEEEEIVNWMISDRKEYLQDIQKQILKQKTELNKVKEKNSLAESQVVDFKSGSEASSYGLEGQLIDNEIENLKKLGIINEDIEIASWKNGYYFGFDKGRIEGFGEGEKIGIEKAEIDNEEELSDNCPSIELKVPRKSVKRGLEGVKKRNLTKIQEFHFQRKSIKSGTVFDGHKQNLLEEFLEEPLSSIVKSSKMSKKMVLKTISVIFSSAAGNKNTTLGLANFTYEEFYLKYRQKSIVAKKYLGFVSALVKFPESRRIVTFSKLFGIGPKLGLEGYVRPKESFLFLVSFLEKISKSTLGIIIDADDTVDYQFIPTIRALDCSKEAMSPFVDSQKMQVIIETITSKSFQDPKKINKSGIICQEVLIDFLLDELNNYYKDYLNNICDVFQGVCLSKHLTSVLKSEVSAVIKLVSPLKFEKLVGSSNPYELISQFCKSLPGEKSESFQSIQDLCIHFGLLSVNDISLYFGRELDMEQCKQIIGQEIEEYGKCIEQLFNDWQRLGLEQDYIRNIEYKVHKIEDFSGCSGKSLLISWKVLIAEIINLTNNNL